MGQVIPFPIEVLNDFTELDHCWECTRLIHDGENYLEVPFQSSSQVIHKAICEDCEEHFLSKMTRPVFLTDLTACR